MRINIVQINYDPTDIERLDFFQAIKPFLPQIPIPAKRPI
jgi:hypothetical protein